MINWARTTQESGVNEQTVVSKSRIVAICEQCKAERIIKYPGYQFIMKEHGNSYCSSCRSKDNRIKYAQSFKESDVRRAATLSKTFKKKWQDPEYREMQQEIKGSEDYKQKIGNATKECWKDEKFREKVTASVQKLYEDKEYREKLSILRNSDGNRAKLKERWQDPAYREKVLGIWKDEEFTKSFKGECVKRFEDPVFREKMRVAHEKMTSSPAFKEKMAKITTQRWQDPVYREEMAKVRTEQRGKQSSIQKLLYSMLDDLKVQYTTDEDAANAIGYYVWDCKIEKQGKMEKGLLIDVNGDYWHHLPNTVRSDKAKSTYTTKHFTHLYDVKYVWEHEFQAKDRVVSLLRYWLKMSGMDQVDFSFDDLMIREIGVEEADLFISKWHYAGRLGRGGVKHGAFLDDKLIAVCVYAPTTRQETATLQGCKFNELLELSRFCIHPSYQKKNLATWFIARTIKDLQIKRPEIKKLVSFSDSTYNHLGTIYKASNWRLDCTIKPDYWYVDKDGYVIHKKTLWNHAVRMSQTEAQYCTEHGYQKVWGGEKRRYSLSI